MKTTMNDELKVAISKLGKVIAAQIAAGMLDTKAARDAKPRKHVAAKHLCAVPYCKRSKLAKGLCGTHYTKASKNKLDMDNLSAKDLRFLSLDGRALRWQMAKKAA